MIATKDIRTAPHFIRGVRTLDGKKELLNRINRQAMVQTAIEALYRLSLECQDGDLGIEAEIQAIRDDLHALNARL